MLEQKCHLYLEVAGIEVCCEMRTENSAFSWIHILLCYRN